MLDTITQIGNLNGKIRTPNPTGSSIALIRNISIGLSALILAGCQPAPDAPIPCTDIPPDKQYACPDRASSGQCGEPWMNGYCLRSCGQCTGEETGGGGAGGGNTVSTIKGDGPCQEPVDITVSSYSNETQIIVFAPGHSVETPFKGIGTVEVPGVDFSRNDALYVVMVGGGPYMNFQFHHPGTYFDTPTFDGYAQYLDPNVSFTTVVTCLTDGPVCDGVHATSQGITCESTNLSGNGTGKDLTLIDIHIPGGAESARAYAKIGGCDVVEPK